MENLSRIRIEGFKSIKKLDLKMKSINVLIGANGAGKSNFVSVFRLLENIYNQRLQTYVQANGGGNGFLHFGAQTTNEIIIDLKLKDNGYFANLVKDSE